MVIAPEYDDISEISGEGKARVVSGGEETWIKIE
jgi:hypothetical protein